MDINEYSCRSDVLKEHIYKDGNIKLFIEHGMKPEVNYGTDVFMFAIEALRPKAVKVAIELGLDMYVKTWAGADKITALCYNYPIPDF